MKFRCECDYLFVDQTDFLPYKASLIPDQASEGIAIAVDRLLDGPPVTDKDERFYLYLDITSPKGARTLYQCPQCGRLFIEDGQKLHCFKPEDDNIPRTLLQSPPET